jgi:hypothetical protein
MRTLDFRKCKKKCKMGISVGPPVERIDDHVCKWIFIWGKGHEIDCMGRGTVHREANRHRDMEACKNGGGKRVRGNVAHRAKLLCPGADCPWC